MTGFPLGSADVSAYRLPSFTYAGSADAHLADGTYHIRGLDPGEYVVRARDHDALDELFDNIPCENGDCDFTMGTPIATDLNTDTPGIDFALHEITGSLSGTIIDESTGEPINEAWVSLYSSAGGQPSGRYTDEFGTYRFHVVLPGDYYVFAEAPFTGYLEELWDDIPCPDGPGEGCELTDGDLVSVEFDAVWDIDFALDPSMATGVRGTVTDSATGEPIAGVYVDAWRVDTGNYLTSFVTGSDGTFFDEIYALTYTFSTDTNGRYEEEIYDDIPCPGGSAFQGHCDPATGDHVEVVNGQVVDHIDFILDPGSLIFRDSFETGDTNRWSATAP